LDLLLFINSLQITPKSKKSTGKVDTSVNYHLMNPYFQVLRLGHSMSQANYQTTYDEMPYVSYPYPQTHPDRLSALARLFSVESPDVENCSVLEIGCASGNNLIPMAYLLPKARLVGIDLSAKQIDEGRAEVTKLGLKNLDLRCQSILDFDTKGQQFDFILVHGVYSWVDNNCQEKILDICNKTLTPHGIAYISYNVMPGWRMRGMLRDMMIYHVSKFNDRQSKIYQARALLQFLANSVQGDKNPYGIFLQSELELLRAQNDSYIYHEFLEENNEPCYFHQFVSRCEKHGLAYLGDSDPRTMSTRDMPEQAQKHLSQTISLVETEQYLDFIRNRMFRMSLITRKGKQPIYSVNPSCVQNLHLSSSLTSNEPNLNILATEQASFTCQNGVVMGVGEPLLKASLLVMQKAWPSSMPTMEILEKASAMLGLKLPTDAQALGQLVYQLGQMMVTAYTSMPIGSVEITTRPIPGITAISPKPKLFGFIANQAATLGAVTNIRHQIIRVGDFEKAIINYLDGTHDQDSIVKALLELVKNQTITIQENGSLATPDRAEVVLRERLKVTLEQFLRRGLLEA